MSRCCEIHLTETAPIAVFEVGVAAEAVKPLVAMEVRPLKDFFQHPGIGKYGVLHLIEWEQTKPYSLDPLGAKLLDGDFANGFFGSCRSVRGAPFDGGRGNP